MNYAIEYSKQAEKTLKKWKKSNPALFKKATTVLMDIMEHPRTGILLYVTSFKQILFENQSRKS